MGKAAKSNLRKVEQPVDHQLIPSPHALLAGIVLIKSSHQKERGDPREDLKVSLTRLHTSKASTVISTHRARDHPYHKQMLNTKAKQSLTLWHAASSPMVFNNRSGSSSFGASFLWRTCWRALHGVAPWEAWSVIYFESPTSSKLISPQAQSWSWILIDPQKIWMIKFHIWTCDKV